LKLTFSSMERLVGLFILLAFLAFLATVFAVGRGQNWFRQHHDYYAIYKEGYNLQPGVKVKLLRTDIGQVTNVDLTSTNKVRVRMRILASVAGRIRGDSKAVIESPTFIGSEYINIIPGSYQADQIPPGGQIPSQEQKKISDYLEDLEFEHKLLLLDQVLENVASLSDQLQHPDGPLLGTLANVQKMTAMMKEGEGSLGKVIQQEEMYNKIMQQLDAVEKILQSIKGTATSIEGAADAISSTAGTSAGVAQDMPDLVTRFRNILDKVEHITVDLEKAMANAPEISREARSGMKEVNRILESVKKNILIRGNLPKEPTPETHGLQIRGQ
jgi:phospholipid/cholesterol/gamma-HCH transport system substrate-binding protein